MVWKFSEYIDLGVRHFFRVLDERGFIVHETESFKSESRIKEKRVNARLIAAAPELLEMAQLFLSSIDYQIKRDEVGGDTEGANLKAFTRSQIAAVISKATGGA